MHLFLVQHGLAKSKDEDPERPLSEQGRAETMQIASYLPKLHLQIDAIYHSGKLRALETSKIIDKFQQPEGGVQLADGLSPNDDTSIWAGRLVEMNRNIMLVGHLPHLSKLASILLSGQSDNEMIAFRNSGLVCLKRDEQGGWRIQWILTPDLINNAILRER